MGAYRIAVLKGDGIGPEITTAALKVLEHVVSQFDDLSLDCVLLDAGAAHYRDHGVALPDVVLQECLSAHAVLLSAIGLPDVRQPDGTEIQPEMMVGLRRALELHSAVRPVKLLPGIDSPLRDTSQGIDLVMIRENLEGLFASYGGGSIVGDSVATDTIVITREGTRKVVDFAFRLAERRQGRPLDGKRMVTCVDKANVFRSFAFFRKVFFDVAAEYPAIAADAVYVDALSMYLVQRPETYDVLVMENQFGDILSDLGAGLVGGLGVAPSAELGETHGLFQPSHGTAPDIAGRNIANPLALVLSAAMMLDWLATQQEDPTAAQAAQLIESGVESLLSETTTRTPDLGGIATTSDIADALVAFVTLK